MKPIFWSCSCCETIHTETLYKTLILSIYQYSANEETKIHRKFSVCFVGFRKIRKCACVNMCERKNMDCIWLFFA